MNFWIDRSGSEFQNVIVVTENAIILGSSDKHSHDKIEVQLKQNVNPLEIFASDDLDTIPYTAIHSLVSRNTDPDIELKYKAKKDIEEVTLDFENAESSDDFLAAIEVYLPQNFKKKENQQSVITAGLAPLLSALIGGVIVYLYFNKYRMIAMIGGGIWILGSLYMLFKRVANPPRVTHWGVMGGYVKKTWQGVKTLGSSLIAAAFIFFHSYGTADAYGEKALFEQIVYEEVAVEDIQKYLERGADINYQDTDGETALAYALYAENNELATELINVGADVNMTFYGESTVLDIMLDSEVDLDLMKIILDKLETKDQETLSGFIEYALETEQTELAELLKSHME